MDLGVQMIREVLDCGVEQLGCEYTGARQHDQRPPKRPGLQDQHGYHHHDKDADLNPEAALATRRMR